MSHTGSSGSGMTVYKIVRKKRRGERIVALTAYDYPTARILDDAGVDLILVGDSAANVVYGMKTTLTIGMEEMIYHTRAVAAGVSNALVVADMPFMSYQASADDAVMNAGRFLRAGAAAVKLEGAARSTLEVVRRLVELGIPVLGHLGLTPQSVHQLGGYRLQARSSEERKRLLADAKLLQDAGCFGVVLEKIPTGAARRVTAELAIPTIGIGAGVDCDGQVLVLHDMLGVSDAKPFKFVKRYADLYHAIHQAVSGYCDDVRSGQFPDDDHSFNIDADD